MSEARYQMISSIEETNWQQATTVDSSKWPIEDGNKPTEHQGEAMMMVPKPLGEVAGGVTERHESATTSKLDLLAVLLSNLVGMESSSQEENKNTNAVDSEEAQGPPTITDLDETSGSGSSRQDVYSPLTPPDSQLSLFYYPSTGGAGTAEYTGPVTYYAAADGGQYFHVDANTAAAWPSIGQQNGTLFQWQAMNAEQSEQEEQDNSAEMNYDRQEPATPAEDHQVDRHEAPRSLPSSSSANENTLLELAAKFSRMRFPAKLWNLANDANFGPITWSVNGTSLIIDEFALEPTLHYFFRSHKYSSFLRQLHLYGFRKVTRMRSYKGDQEQERTSYINEYSARDFVRGRLDLLHKVRRFYSAAPKKDKRDKKLLSTPPPPTPVPIYTVNSPHHQFLEEHSYYSLTPVMFAIAPQELQQYHQNNISPILVDDSSSSSSSASSASSASDMHGALHSAPLSF